MRTRHILIIICSLALFLLHYDWWNWQPNTYLVFGLVPLDLVYHILWVALSCVVLGFVLRTFWAKTE